MNKPPCTQLHHILERQAAAQPEGIALWWQGAATNYATLQRNSMAVAARLAAGGSAGDRVAVLSWNCLQFVELIYAVSAVGKILVPLNARLAPAELIYQLNTSGAALLFGDSALLAPVLGLADFPAGIERIALDDEYLQWRSTGSTAQLPQTQADDAAWILFTSGAASLASGASGASISSRSSPSGTKVDMSPSLSGDFSFSMCMPTSGSVVSGLSGLSEIPESEEPSISIPPAGADI